MSSFLRWMLLGLFGATGAAVAFCVALSSPPQVSRAEFLPEQRRTDPPEREIETIEARPTAFVEPKAADLEPPKAEPAPLAVDERDEEPGPSGEKTVEVIRGPVILEPYPAISQQFTAPDNSEFLQQIREELQRALKERPTPAAEKAEDEPEAPPVQSEPLPPPLPQPAPLPDPAPAAPVRGPTARVEEAGDDKLSIQIHDTDIREVLDLMSQQGGLNILPSQSVQGKVSASLSGVDLDTALAAILRSTGYVSRREGAFVYVGTTQDFQSMEQSLDKIGTRIFRPSYVRAAELQSLITPLLSPGIGAVSISSPAEVGIPADNNKAGGDGFAGGEAVLVRDYEAVLSQVDQVVAEIDQRPLQVAIEAMILSVKLDDEHECGVDFQVLRNRNKLRIASGSPFNDVADVDFNNGGLKFGFLDSNLGAFVNSLESIGDTNVIATPRLTCLNKQRAEILIGAQLGYISTTVTETSTAQSVEFLEVGTQLRLRPFISPDGMIRMEVHPELSTGSVQLKGAFTLPEKEVTQVTTNIMVRDGCTVVIGGLMREDLASSASQLPVLGNIPGIGFMFRQKKETTERREILVLITPHIIHEDEACREGDQAACEFERRQELYADQMSPLGKRHLGRKYLKLAQKSWQCSNREQALEHLDLSIKFDPLNREAIELRSEILASQSSCRHGPQEPCARCNSARPAAPGDEIEPWMLEDLAPSPEPGPKLRSAAGNRQAESGRRIERPNQSP